ncbi:MAG: zinc-finger domain-containing protein [Gammaproteobacteria bacterium]|nr:zinc-finger domain-containing protein [Gammaproteobacteria bacterium]
MAQDKNGTTPNSLNNQEVTNRDLPLHCPVKGTTTWDSHPRVYIPIKENGGHAKCPYCGTEYSLKD